MKRLNSREQVRRASFSKSVACNVRCPGGKADADFVDFVDDGVCRSKQRLIDTRRSLGGLHSVAGGGCFFGAFGFGGGRTRGGFGGSSP